MTFRECTYSVLVVSSGKDFAESISSRLPVSEYWPVMTASSGGEARRKLLDNSFDIAVVNSPLSDESGIRLAEDISSDNETGILLFVKNDFYDEIYGRVCEKGIMVLPKPTSLQLVTQAIRLLCTVKERMKRAEAKQATVEDKIKEIRLLNRAKWMLIEKEKMSEQEAHRYIEKKAMDERISKAEAAKRIVAG